MTSLRPPTLDEIYSARDRLKALAVRAPLLRLNADDEPADIYLKMENLRLIGSFKIQPAGSAILNTPGEQLAQGVYTCSSGNMAQGVAYAAMQLGIPARVLLPHDAATNKVSALERLNAKIRFLPDDEWWQVINQHGHPDIPGRFIHPVASQDILAGDATVGLEIFEDLPGVDTVLVPFSGGGLACGIASAFRELKPDVRVLGSESEHCVPLAAARSARHPLQIPIPRTFISGIGVGTVLEQMWTLVKELIEGSVIASERDIADTIKMMFERHRVIVEGAGAAPIAAALKGKGGDGKVVCVISGGDLDNQFLIDILHGKMPRV